MVWTRLRQGYRTMRYPSASPPPARFRGRPRLAADACASCLAASGACPTGALALRGAGGKGGRAPSIDLGACLFCGDCEAACPRHALTFTKDYRLAVRERGDLLLDPGRAELALARELDRRMKRLFGRSLKLRQVSAGGCGACEADANVLTTVGWDLGRFGIQFVTSPRHADGLLVTGPVTRNMVLALRKTYDALRKPRLVIAVGSCAISDGLYADREDCLRGAGALMLESGPLPVDLYIPGCPPHPLTTLDGLLRLIGRIQEDPEGRGRRGEEGIA
jgi:Ni,Fe-hydrogenase III small subunit